MLVTLLVGGTWLVAAYYILKLARTPAPSEEDSQCGVLETTSEMVAQQESESTGV